MQDVVVLTILLEDMTPLSLCTGTFLETGVTQQTAWCPDDVHHSKGRLISSFSSLGFFSASHRPGRSSYYFLQSEMGGDVCSGNSSHIPDKVTIPSPTFRQWNVKVERSIIWRSQFVLQKKQKKNMFSVIFLWVTAEEFSLGCIYDVYMFISKCGDGVCAAEPLWCCPALLSAHEAVIWIRTNPKTCCSGFAPASPAHRLSLTLHQLGTHSLLCVCLFVCMCSGCVDALCCCLKKKSKVLSSETVWCHH